MKVGHVSFLGLLNHTQMRAQAFRLSQFSGFERAVKHWSGLVPNQDRNFPCTLRLVPTQRSRVRVPFTEQTEHIQKRARLQPVGCGYMLTLDAGESQRSRAWGGRWSQ
jgi:hypothetical protein